MQVTNRAHIDTLSQQLAKTIATDIELAINQYGQAHVALAGGSTPVLCMRYLSEYDLEWSKVIITLTDERWLSTDNPRSNHKLITDNLLIHKAINAQFISLFTVSPTATEGLAEVQQSLQPFRLHFDVCLLGMGEDGHFASLFPDSPQLQIGLTTTDNAVAVTSPSVPEERITMSLNLLQSANKLYLLITGDKKKSLIKRHKTSKSTQLPIDILLESTPVHIYHD